MSIQFNQKELDLILEILRSRLGTLREEIYHAEAPAFKDDLKQKKEVLQAVIGKIEGAQGASTPLSKAG